MLKGKVAVVTGGSRGIGRAICLKLAENGADIALIFAGNEEKAQETAVRPPLLACVRRLIAAMWPDIAETTAVFKQILTDFGGIHILVNNAGITRDKLLLAMSEEDFDAVVGVNLKGAFNTIKQVYRPFSRQRSGKIINITSVSGLMGNPGQANYSASKAGLIGLTKTVAKELASRGVCCNAVAPGFVETDMTRDFTDNEVLKNSIPLKRFGKPEDIAELVLFLASDVSNYITGEVIRCDGGMAM